MSRLISALSQYAVLEQTSEYLTTRDLVNLATACKRLHVIILESTPIFMHLKRLNICDGKGLLTRQRFGGLYSIFRYGQKSGVVTYGRRGTAEYDEELEVKVWNSKCDAANALPCLKCGTNVCEECRYYQRVRDTPEYKSYPKPHIDPAFQNHDLICFCTNCDPKIEADLPHSLEEFCDCDQYKRWICLSCKNSEIQETNQYYKQRTRMEFGGDEEAYDYMLLGDHQHERAFWCPCGERAPKDGNVRCTWCKRKHNLKTWFAGSHGGVPFFDDDPCYPKMEYDRHGEVVMHPTLGYTGPIAP